MKQIHLRLSDDDYDKLVKEAALLNISLNKLVTYKVFNHQNFSTDSVQKSSQTISEIHRDLIQILLDINDLKAKLCELNSPEKLIEIVTEMKSEILKKLQKIQCKLPKN